MEVTTNNNLKGLFSDNDMFAESDLYKCVHCGFCLQACPTYLDTGLETESPRGRIALMKAVNEGRIGISANVIRHWDLCVQCRACEIACPSGVPYGRLIESTMAIVKHHRKSSILSKFIYNVSLRHILPRQKLLEWIIRFLRLYQRTGLQTILRKTRLIRILPGNLAELEQSLPKLPDKFFYAKGQTIQPRGSIKSIVSLLSGCVMPLINGPEMDAVVRVLARNGCEVTIPKNQVCCGAINTHVGDLETARQLARRNIDTFLNSSAQSIVVASAGCGVRMKEYGHLLLQDPDYAEKANKFSSMVKDIHEFLADLPLTPPKGKLDYTVTYQDSCHLSNAQAITAQPRTLIQSIPGVKFVELKNSAICCGAGGTYTITERESSQNILNAKMKEINNTSADIIASANPGCVLQLQLGSKTSDVPIEVRYVTDLLDESYRLEDGAQP